MRICTFDGCKRKHEAHGYCRAHYHQLKRNGFVKELFTQKFDCDVSECDKPHKAMGYCAKHYKILSRYDIEPDIYEKLMAQQDNKCAICLKECDLVVDHSHVTGKVRQLLCALCNRGIGFLQDDYQIVLNAAQYLKKWEEE